MFIRTRWNVSVRFRSNWNLKVLAFKERGKPDYPEKNLSEQGRVPTTNSTHIWRRRQDSNSGHIGARRVLSSLRHPCSPMINNLYSSFLPYVHIWDQKLQLLCFMKHFSPSFQSNLERALRNTANVWDNMSRVTSRWLEQSEWFACGKRRFNWSW